MSTFSEDFTSDASFTLASGEEINVPTMHQEEWMPYGETEDFEVIDLPFRGGELSMTFVLPAEGQFDAFERSLSAERWSEVINTLDSSMINLSLPKFEFETSVDLSAPLNETSLAVLFTSDADLSGIFGMLNYFVTGVFHKTFIKIDEGGAEAAAATAIIVGTTSEPPPSKRVSFDRPFFFAIRDQETQIILFFGRVMNP